MDDDNKVMIWDSVTGHISKEIINNRSHAIFAKFNQDLDIKK